MKVPLLYIIFSYTFPFYELVKNRKSYTSFDHCFLTVLYIALYALIINLCINISEPPRGELSQIVCGVVTKDNMRIDVHTRIEFYGEGAQEVFWRFGNAHTTKNMGIEEYLTTKYAEMAHVSTLAEFKHSLSTASLTGPLSELVEKSAHGVKVRRVIEGEYSPTLSKRGYVDLCK